MIYLLKIGYQRFAFRSDKGISTIMNCLSTAAVVDRDDRYKGGGIELEEKPIDIGLEVVHGYHFTNRKKAKCTVINPEVLPPHPFPALPGSRNCFSRLQISGGES